MFKRSLFVSALFLAVGQASALEITADGDLKDWLAAAPMGSVDDWTPKAGVKYMVDDEDTYYLDPGYGGQEYDAEAIYVHKSTDYLSIAIVTGLSHDGPHRYPAGDIAIDFNYDPNSTARSFDVGIVTLDATGIGDAGDVYDVTTWNYGLWDAPGHEGDPTSTDFGLAHPTSIASGDRLGSVNFFYGDYQYYGKTPKLGAYAGSHYVIEALIPTSLLVGFDLNNSFFVHWTMLCANDYVEVDPPAVPVPATLSLLLLGLLPMLRRKGTRT